MDKISISAILNKVHNGAHVRNLYVENGGEREDYAVTLFEKKHITHRSNDEVIKIGNKEVNISELERILVSLKGKGQVTIWLDGKILKGDIKD